VVCRRQKCLAAVEFSAANHFFTAAPAGTHTVTRWPSSRRGSRRRYRSAVGLPKGRRNIRESDDSCALRGIQRGDRRPLRVVHRASFHVRGGSWAATGSRTKTQYFLARLMNRATYTRVVTDAQAKEVACTRWMTYQRGAVSESCRPLRRGWTCCAR
jgi:hypothetical protein